MNGEGDLIARCVTTCLEHYFADLAGEQPCGVYEMVMAQVEKPLLQKVLQECEGNQTRAAVVLGLNRNTLRKKMQQHGLLPPG